MMLLLPRGTARVVPPARWARRRLPRAAASALVAALAASASLHVLQAGSQSPPQPVFRSGVDLVRLDVTVVSNDGRPVDDLEAQDFEVRVNGDVRPVQSLRFLQLQPGPLELQAGTSLAASREYSSNERVVQGRMIVIVVDHESVPPGGSAVVIKSAEALLAGLGPADRVALLTIPQPGPKVDFTSDMRQVREALGSITGYPRDRQRAYRITFDEAVQIDRRSSIVTAKVIERECAYRQRLSTCPEDVVREARDTLMEGRNRILMTLSALSGIAESLFHVEGPKTLVFLSGGLPMESGSTSRFQEMARKALQARLQTYVVHLDSFAFDTSERLQSAADVLGEEQEGLQTVVGMTGGTFFRGVGKAQAVFERIERESRGAYVIGVEPPPGATRDKALRLDVKVRRPGLTVRTPRQVVPPDAPAWDSAKRAIGYTLRQPRPATALPLRVNTFTVRGEHPQKLRVLVSAEFPRAGVAPGDLAWGLEVVDQGRIVADAFQDAAPGTTPATDDPAVLTAIDVPPGTHVLRFAALDPAGRRGSVEHPFTAALGRAGDVQVSDLLAGVEAGGRFEPRVEVPASGPLTLLIELYAADETLLDGAEVEFSLTGRDGASRGATRVPAQETTSPNRRVAQATLPLEGIGAGTYTAGATLVIGGSVSARVSRPTVIVAAPPPAQ